MTLSHHLPEQTEMLTLKLRGALQRALPLLMLPLHSVVEQPSEIDASTGVRPAVAAPTGRSFIGSSGPCVTSVANASEWGRRVGRAGGAAGGGV